MTEDEIVGWHHRLDGHEFEQAQEFPEEMSFPVRNDREAWRAAVLGVTKSQTQLSN